jgi:hypothetical protein
MNIGIYGDSFTEYDIRAKEFHWSSIVASKLNAETTNLGRSSTSLFYSYKEFLKNYTKHDLILFAVTEPERYTKIFDWCDRPLSIRNNGYVSNYSQTQALKREATNEQDKKMLTHLEGWFIMNDPAYQNDMHELMLQHMESLHKNIIFYPCFDRSFSSLRYSQHNFPVIHNMYSIFNLQLQLVNYDRQHDTIDGERENPNVIAGHLAPEMNEHIAEAMLNKITTGYWKFSDLYDIKLKNPASYYYN